MDLTSFRRIGVNSAQERLYRALIDNPEHTPATLSEAEQLQPDLVETELEELIQLGLVTDQAPGHRYAVTDPEAAIAVLIRREQQKLDNVRLESTRLTHELRATRQHSNASSIVEVLTGEALKEQWGQGQRTARERIRMTDRPPYFTKPTVESMQTERDRIAAGLTYQVVYDQATFEDPAHVDRVMAAIGWGEQARVMPGVPLKLVLVDDQFAMVLISRPAQMDEPTVILVRPSALLDALSSLFDLLWGRGVAISGDGERIEGSDVPSELLTHLALGLKDEAIAHEMGVTVRTVRRRISDLYQQLGVHNRFQAGVAANARGWV